MTIIIKNSRQFNSMLANAENSNEQITAMLAYAADQLHKHKNKDPIIKLYNSTAWRTKAGKISAKGKPVISYLILSGQKAMQLGTLDNGNVTPFNATTAPDKLLPNMVHNTMAEGAELLSFDDFLSRNDDKEKSTPTNKPVTVNAFVKQLETVIQRGLSGDNADLDKASALLKQALNVLAKAYVADDTATVLAAGELADVPPSSASRSAGQKKAS